MYYGQVVLCDACSVEVWGSNACGGSYKENRGKAGLELGTCPGLLGFYLGPYERKEGKVGLFG